METGEVHKVKIGIIGHAEDKFTPQSSEEAKRIIRTLLLEPGVTLVSGRSPLGGIDVYAEEVADQLGVPKDIKAPGTKSWSGKNGYRERNLAIAEASDKVFVLVVDEYPASYKGLRFNQCYHCGLSTHVKSGACWTAKKAQAQGKKAFWIIIQQRR